MIDVGRKSRGEDHHCCVHFGLLGLAREGVRVGSLGVPIDDTLNRRVDTQGGESDTQKDLHDDNQQSKLRSAFIVLS